MAVRSNCINFFNRVRLNDLLIPSSTGPIAPNQYNVLQKNSPLALDPDQTRPKIEDEVIPLRGDWSGDADPESRRSVDDRGLGNRSLLIRCHASQRTDRLGWAVSVWDTRDPGYNPGERKRTSEI